MVPGSWQHIALSYEKSSGQAAIYLNGVAIVQANLGTFTPQTSFTNFLIGARTTFGTASSPADKFSGQIDELSIYSRALSLSEIQAIYGAGIGGKCPVPAAPFIVGQPANQTVTVGGTATFSVAAGGSQPLSYQWNIGGTDIPGATSSTLTLTNVQFNQAGNYAVAVTNAAGATNSAGASLTVNFPPATVRALNVTNQGGATFTVPVVLAANGNENALGFSLNFSTTRLTYVSTELGSGATGATLLTNETQAANGRVGIAVGLSSGSSFPAGTQEPSQLPIGY